MQAVAGVDCYCCGRVLGSNPDCGKDSTSQALKKRPPCLWAHTDPTIVATCVRKMKENKGAELQQQQGNFSQRLKLSKSGDSTVRPSKVIPVLPNGTQVYVVGDIGKGCRGVVAHFNAQTCMYTVKFQVPWVNMNSSGADAPIRQADVFEYIDDPGLFPVGSLPHDASVRCGNGVTGIIQGVVCNHLKVPLSYDVGPNATGHNFFTADKVHLVQRDHGLSGDFTARMAQVGQMLMGFIAPNAPSQAPPHATATVVAAACAAVGTSTSPSAVHTKMPSSGSPHAPTAAPRAVGASASSTAPLAAVGPTPRPPSGVPVPGKPSSAVPKGAGATTRPPPVPTARVMLGSDEGSASSSSDSDMGSNMGSSSSALRCSDGEAPDAAAAESHRPVQPAETTHKRSKGLITSTAPRKPPTSGRKASSPAPRKTHGGDSDDAPLRKRAQKFNHDHEDEETLTCFMQIARNVPWLHSRPGQKAIWKQHLHALWEKDHALELRGHKDGVKTFAAWASNICKTRRTSRLIDMRKSGVGTFEMDVVDDVVHRWEEKVLGDEKLAASQQQRAAIMREVMTSTSQSVSDLGAKIERDRKKRYAVKRKQRGEGDDEAQSPSGGAFRTPQSASKSVHSSPSENARASLLQQLNTMTSNDAAQSQKDAALVASLVQGVVAAVPASTSAGAGPATGMLANELLLLQNFLQAEDSSLCAWAPAILAALGVTEGSHFQELTAADILSAAGVPQLQKKRLLAVATRYGLSS